MRITLRTLLWVFLAVSVGYLAWTLKDIVTNTSPGLSWSNLVGAISSSSLAAILLLSGRGRTNPKPQINPNQLGEKAEN
jgi:hypothetical protein